MYVQFCCWHHQAWSLNQAMDPRGQADLLERSTQCCANGSAWWLAAADTYSKKPCGRLQGACGKSRDGGERWLSCCKKVRAGSPQRDFRKAERHRHTVKTPPATAAGEEEKRKTHALLQQYSKRSSIEAHPCCLGEETRGRGDNEFMLGHRALCPCLTGFPPAPYSGPKRVVGHKRKDEPASWGEKAQGDDGGPFRDIQSSGTLCNWHLVL